MNKQPETGTVTQKMRYNTRFRCYNREPTRINERNVRQNRTLQRRGGTVAGGGTAATETMCPDG